MRDMIGLLSAGMLAATTICPGEDTTILRMAKQWTDPAKDCSGTIWRYHETWRTDVARRESGELVNVDPDVCRQKAPGGNDKSGPFELAVARKVVGSEFASAGWEQPDFDDNNWARHPGPIAGWYRRLATINLRGKFQVSDPAKAADLALAVSFQGGAVAYLNGKEIGREGLPPGKIAPETLANDYPLETTAKSAGKTDGLLSSGGYFNNLMPDVPTKEAAPSARNPPVEQYQKRFRTLSLKIPAAALRKGVNVLAIEIHRAPAHAIMFTAVDTDKLIAYGGSWSEALFNHGVGWNRCWVDDIRLTTTASGSAITPNVSRPNGLQVWNASLMWKLLPTHFGDPNESVQPIRLTGLRNGTFSGQIVVSSPKAIKGFQATVSALKTADDSSLPESAVGLGYAKWDDYCAAMAAEGSQSGAQFDSLDPVAPREIPCIVPACVKLGGTKVGPFNVAIQPICLSVSVPRDAKAGDYIGELAISAEGEKPVKVPVQLRVAGNWVLPDPKDFKTFVGMVESPESVALQYGVKMWSEEHWKLLDQAFALMGSVGVDDLYIPLLAKTNLANDDSMVRWVKQADGSYKHDFSVVERYLDLAVKHLGKKCLVVFWVHDYPFFRGGVENWVGKSVGVEEVNAAKGAGKVPLPYTELDPGTGQTTEKQAPQWGTPEARTFWKPVFDSLIPLLAKRGMEKNMMLGCDAQYLNPKCVEDCKALAPGAHWYRRNHHVYDVKGAGYFNWGSACYVGSGSDVMVVDWEPDESATGFYRWRSPAWKTAIPTVTGAWSMNQGAELPIFRVMAESILLSNGKYVVHGIGSQGADYWPVMTMATDPRGKQRTAPVKQSRLSIYTDQGSVLDHSSATFAFLGRGKNGPVPTYHLRLLQESLQDMEVRIFVQDALLDQKGKLSADLARRCKEVCDDRTRQLHYYSGCMMAAYHRVFPHDIFDDGWYRQNTATLYALAGEVSKALEQ